MKNGFHQQKSSFGVVNVCANLPKQFEYSGKIGQAISKISELSRDAFVAAFGGVYEHSPWIAETCFDRAGHGNARRPSDLATPLATVVAAGSPEAQLALLQAHPDLAGKLAKSGVLTAESTSEQAGAGLDQCTEAEFDAFTELNDAYKSKFGFPFILAVKGWSRADILDNFRTRAGNSKAGEFREALRQVDRIARFRLEALDVDYLT